MEESLLNKRPWDPKEDDDVDNDPLGSDDDRKTQNQIDPTDSMENNDKKLLTFLVLELTDTFF